MLLNQILVATKAFVFHVSMQIKSLFV